MAIRLRESEQIQAEAQLHWANYVVPGIWAVFTFLAMIGAAFSKMAGAALFDFLLGSMPLLYVFLKNSNKSYVITNERLYVEEGILAKSKRDIPLDKINNFETAQGLIQRIFGAGDVLVLTGNDRPTKLTNVAESEAFREAASKLISTKRAS